MHTRTLAALAAAAVAPAAFAAAYTIADGNSVAVFDDALGQISWTVGRTNHIASQSFYFRIDGDDVESPLGSLSTVGTVLADTNPFSDQRPDAFGILYSGRGLDVEVLYTLRGSQPGGTVSDIAEQIVLRNRSQGTLSLSFFQFVDFNLLGSTNDDTVSVSNGNTLTQTDGQFAYAEEVVTPTPFAYQVDTAANLTNLFNDQFADNLNNSASAGPGDLAWAFQWNITLAEGETFIISKDKLLVVPTPGSATLLAAGGLLAALRIRRR
jgi:hypothetical protein